VSRAFFALWPDAALRARLRAEVLARLGGVVGRPLEPLDWHVTLRFLGRIDAAQLAALRAQADEVRASPIELRFEAIEYWAQARVLALVALAEVPREARALAQALERLARAAGLGAQERPLRPHLTLVRGVRTAPAPGVTGRLPDLSAPGLTWQASEFHLAESIVPEPLGASERRYRTLQSWPLRA
jgi:RNA 2',3'-cyclic 3'-phosphodiesterase